MNKKITVKELRLLSCPECRKSLIDNLKMVNFFKTIEFNEKKKVLFLETINESASIEETNQILDAMTFISKCDKHQQMEEKEITTEFLFDGVDCPNCASKIEKNLNRKKEIFQAKVNFINKTAIITHKENVDILNIVISCFKGIEKDAIVYLKNEEKPKVKNNKILKLIFNIIGLILFIGSIILEKVFNFEYVIYLYLATYLVLGFDVLKDTINRIIHKDIFNENLLMVVASLGALFINEGIESIMVIILYMIGETLKDKAIDNSTKQIKDLIGLQVDEVTLVDGTIKNIKDTKEGEIIIVKVGERIPLDGRIIEGNTDLDTSSITGESLPRFVKEDDQVISGSYNLTSVIKVKVEKEYNDSTSTIVYKLIDEANNKKAKIDEFITKFARIYTPIVMLLAVFIFLLQYFGLSYDLNNSLNNAFVFLVISCPCALVISIPLAYFSGIGKGSKEGILIRGANYLEALVNTKHVVFDKTGTLTVGKFRVTKVNPNNISEEELLKMAAHMEMYSNHPIAISIKESYHQTFDENLITNITEIPGFGLKGLYLNKTLLLGNKKLLEQNNIIFEEEKEIGSIVYLAYDNKYIGDIVISDEIKSSSKKTINLLKQQNCITYMLTGDNRLSAEVVGKELEINQIHSELLPQDKLKIVENIINNKNKKETVVYIGDGLNDAPVLRLSDVGIAMGNIASDATKEAADVVITSGDLEKVNKLLKISKYTRKIIIQNIVLSLGIKIIAMLIVSFNLLGDKSNLGMIIGLLADVGVSILAVLNSIRIIYNKKI